MQVAEFLETYPKINEIHVEDYEEVKEHWQVCPRERPLIVPHLRNRNKDVILNHLKSMFYELSRREKILMRRQ